MSGWDSMPAQTNAGTDPWGGGPDASAWNNGSGHDVNDFGGDNSAPAADFTNGEAGDACTGCGQTDHPFDVCPSSGGPEVGPADANDKCFGCGQPGHRRAECPAAEEMACRYCKQAGHMIRDCPEKPPMVCGNCRQEGHLQRECENARVVNRDHIADVSSDDAWEKIIQAVSEKDMDDAKEAVQEFVKSVGGAITYRELQEALINQGINLWLIAVERQLLNVFTNMDLQGNMGKKYNISYRFSEKPQRPREIEGWPGTREEILNRLDEAGEAVDSGKSKCHNCDGVGHIAKACPEPPRERPEKAKATCYNCGAEGHRVRDCPEPRVDKLACRNCSKSGHKASECEEPPNMDNVECRKCNEMGHFAKDCPQGGGSECRNCAQEGHIAKECDQPRNMDNVICRNCEKNGHFSRDCPEPKDWGKVQCSNCQEFGHTKVRCKKAPAETDGFDDGGFDNAASADAAGDSGWGPAAPAVEIASAGW